jgi:hypothetical protein
MILRKAPLAPTELDLSLSLTTCLEAGDDPSRNYRDIQRPTRDALRATVSTLHGDADFAIRANFYLSLLPGF